MTLKFTAILLSSVLASASYAADEVTVAGTEIVVPSQAVIQRVVPDSFERAGKYRVRRAALESRLKSFEGKKLKEFTSEIFAGMLTEAIDVAKLGFHVAERLPELTDSIHQDLSALESTLESRNALISWRDLRALTQAVDMYRTPYWKEFQLDMEDLLRKANLQPQVFSAHRYVLKNHEGWKNIEGGWNNFERFSLYEHYSAIEKCSDGLNELIKNKFNEDGEESIANSYETFQKALRDRGMALVYDLSDQRYESDHPRFKIEKWMKAKMKHITLDIFEYGMFKSDHLVFGREKVSRYLEDGTAQNEWYVFNSDWLCINSVRFVERKEVRDDSIEFKPEVKIQDVYEELKTNLENSIQAALEETFEWLTQ